MDAMTRAAAIYVVVWLFFRLSGRRTLAQMTAFDFILLLICGQATQQALLGNDHSITNALLVVLTLISIDGAVTMLQSRSAVFAKVVQGRPLLLVRNGEPLRDRMSRERVSEEDILHEARSKGFSRLDQIRHAVLEPSGGISIIAWEQGRSQGHGDG